MAEKKCDTDHKCNEYNGRRSVSLSANHKDFSVDIRKTVIFDLSLINGLILNKVSFSPRGLLMIYNGPVPQKLEQRKLSQLLWTWL